MLRQKKIKKQTNKKPRKSPSKLQSKTLQGLIPAIIPKTSYLITVAGTDFSKWLKSP